MPHTRNPITNPSHSYSYKTIVNSKYAITYVIVDLDIRVCPDHRCAEACAVNLRRDDVVSGRYVAHADRLDIYVLASLDLHVKKRVGNFR